MKFKDKKNKEAMVIQNEPFAVALKVQNISNSIFLGGSIEAASLKQPSGAGVSNNFPIQNRMIPQLEVNQTFEINTMPLVTHLYGSCFIDFQFKASDKLPIEIYTPNFEKVLEKQVSPNKLLNSCFVYSQESISNNRLAKANSFLALIATVVSCVALYISLSDNEEAELKFVSLKALLKEQLVEYQKLNQHQIKANEILGNLNTVANRLEKKDVFGKVKNTEIVKQMNRSENKSK